MNYFAEKLGFSYDKDGEIAKTDLISRCLLYRDMENKKSMTPPSSFDPKASIIDMALPMCVPKTDGVFATTANTPKVKPASASMLASTDSDSEISSFCAESVGR